LLWLWFKYESPVLIALNALISIFILALIVLMTPIGGERVHWPDTVTLEAYVGVAFLALASLKVARARFARRRSLIRRLSGSASTIAFAMMGSWLLAVWFYESHSSWFFKSGILTIGGSLPAGLNYFDGSIVPLLAPTLAALFGLVLSVKQLKSIRRVVRERKGKVLPFCGFVASACTLTIGAYAADHPDFGWDDSLAAIDSGQHSARPNNYEPLFASGVSCHISEGFGPRRNPFDKRLDEFHPGIDIAAATGTPIHAMSSGTVIFSGMDRGFGNMVAIRADDGGKRPTTLLAAHMQRLFVATGSEVHGGDLIGLVGTTGRSTGPHVHLQLCPNGHRNRSGGFVCGTAENPYESWHTLSAIARSSCARGPIV
jgi:hypothetical protein